MFQCTKRIKALNILIESMTEKRAKIVEQLIKINNVRLD